MIWLPLNMVSDKCIEQYNINVGIKNISHVVQVGDMIDCIICIDEIISSELVDFA